MITEAIFLNIGILSVYAFCLFIGMIGDSGEGDGLLISTVLIVIFSLYLFNTFDSIIQIGAVV